MKQQRPKEKNKKTKALSNTKGRHRNPGLMTAGWGRGASDYRPGIFTKQYLLEHHEGCCADVYYALGQEIRRLNQERIQIGEKAFRRPNYSSFARYFHWFRLLGLIESSGRQEPAVYHFLRQRQFYRLTAKGEAEEAAWRDPVRAAHPEFG